MNKKFSHVILLAAIIGLLMAMGRIVKAQQTEALVLQPEFPKIVLQPDDQMIKAGSNVTLTASAENADSYQWYYNQTIIDGATNSNLTIENVSVGDAGYFTCYAIKDAEMIPTRTASLLVYTMSGGGSFMVYASPISGSGSSGSCPGAYAGYVNFTKTVAQGWGWKPDTNTTFHAACDDVRTDTKVIYIGKKGDSDCDQTCVTLPTNPPSSAYRFTIYFPNNVPTTNYPITLTGFLP